MRWQLAVGANPVVAASLVILAVLGCAALFGPSGPNGLPDPTITDASPRPDFYFLSLFAVLALLPPWTETAFLLVVMPLLIVLRLAVPLICSTGEKSWRGRPIAVLSVLLIILTVTTLAALGVVSPWSPIMDAGPALATPVAYVRGRTPLELQGALVIQNKQCRNCHRLGGEGGSRGPALDGVATRLTRDQLVRQVLQGGGNMPAYGRNLTPAEVNALVAFLQTFRPANQPPARTPVDPRPAARPLSDGARLMARDAGVSGSVAPVLGTVIAVGAIYVAGWRPLSRRLPGRFGPGRLAAFLGGLGAIVVAVASPLDALAERLLQAHMTQHMLLMMVAPPLLWLGAPVAPMLRGLPHRIRHAIAVGIATPPLRTIAQSAAHPGVGWVSFALAFWIWHSPQFYELAEGWHHLEHACFFATAMMFWRPVILPWPARSPWPRWTMIPYLLLADLQNTVLAAILTLSDRLIYAVYATAPRMGPATALEDQAIAGLIMWVPGSLVYVLAAVWLVMEALTVADRTPPTPLVERPVASGFQ
jgi:cytochrome c oxidase assembly factor CtaG/mono/diheme cytochrome c family protein